MMGAAPLISGREWLWPVAAGLLVVLLVLAWGYRRAPASGTVRWVCFTLKLAGVLTLAACLLEPVWTRQRARPGANFFAVVADNSQGMQIKDAGASRSRGETLRALLGAEPARWLGQLDEDFQVRRYLFDSRLQGTRDFSELVFDGRASAIGAALRTLTERYRGQPLAGVLLLTDGNATDLPEGPVPLAGLPPVYPVVMGQSASLRDIAVEKVTVSQTVFDDAPVTVQVQVNASGYRGRAVTAELREPSGRVVGTEKAGPRTDDESLSFRFQVRPTQKGVTFHRLRASAEGESDPATVPEPSREATQVNNSRLVALSRGQETYRILYVGGRPNWEYKFLNRALAEDPQLKLISLIRVARREPKFEFRGRPGESSNPLFRGFDRQTEETERYDEPVLMRPNTHDPTELATGFPKTAEELFAYQAVVLDDLEAAFFTPDQQRLIQRFVSERGGGLLMLGGVDSFREGGYAHTPVGEMLPLYLDAPRTTALPKDLRLELTREGWLSPWARLRTTEAEERSRLDALPPFQVLSQVREVKPAASVLASVRDDAGQRYPALVSQRFGHGQVAALLVGDLWRAGLRDEGKREDLEKTWRQLMRWLVVEVPDLIELRVEPIPEDPHQAVRLQIVARDRVFQPLDDATVALTVRQVTNQTTATGLPPSGLIVTATNGIRLAAEPSFAGPGQYEATFVPREAGGYWVQAVVTDAQGKAMGSAEAGWTADPAAEEFRSLKPNRAVLEQIARQTGGEVLAPGDLEQWAATLPRRAAPFMESYSTPLWHQPVVFLFALTCFVAEWGLRRWKGLA
jgi:uncharacterized membrane protein